MTHPIHQIAGRVEGLGVDTEPVARFAHVDRRLFTAAEVAYCSARANPAESFAGRWCAKEAVVKALTGCAGGPFTVRDVEIGQGPAGEPLVEVRGSDCRVLVSIAHDGAQAVAVAWRIAPRADEVQRA